MDKLPVTRIEGSPAEIGEALGRLAQPVMPSCLAQSSAWAALQQWRGHEHLHRLMNLVRETLPDCWEELNGMARGIGMDIADLFLWNCRADLLKHAADGSMCLATNRLADGMIAQNVDGDPLLRDHCHIVDVQPRSKPGFIAFYCPGSLPGHAFSASRHGLVQATNALRAPRLAVGMPGMLLCRALLDAASFAEALGMAMELPRAGAAHHLLGWAGEFIMLSLEATPEHRSMEPVVRAYGHANHLVHKDFRFEPQTVTPASRRRQAQASEQLKTLSDFPDETDLLKILEDDAMSAVPGEAGADTTLASAVFRFTPAEIRLRVRRHGGLLQSFAMPVERNAAASAPLEESVSPR